MTEIPDPNKLSTLISSFLSLFEVSGRLWATGSKVLRGFASEGMYEVLDYESDLVILDAKGKKAIFRKRMVVRYLQDNIIAFPDFGWTDGRGPLDYKVTPGIPVDRYKSGHRTYVVVSLRENKHKGDIDEFNVEWKIKDGFLRRDAFWQTDISHRFGRLALNLILPKRRKPSGLSVEEANRKRTYPISDSAIKKFSDGRWKVSWVNEDPHLYEQYILRWTW